MKTTKPNFKAGGQWSLEEFSEGGENGTPKKTTGRSQTGDPVKDWYWNGALDGVCAGSGCSEIATGLIARATGTPRTPTDKDPEGSVFKTDDAWYFGGVNKKHGAKAIYDPYPGKQASTGQLGPVPEDIWNQTQNFDMVTMERKYNNHQKDANSAGRSRQLNDDAEHAGTIVMLPDGTRGIYHGSKGQFQIDKIGPDGTVILEGGATDGGNLEYKVKGIYRSPKLDDPAFRARMKLNTPVDPELFQVTDQNRYDFSKLKDLTPNEKRYFESFDDATISQLAMVNNVPVEEVNKAILHGASIINNESMFSGDNDESWMAAIGLSRGEGLFRNTKQALAGMFQEFGWKDTSPSRGPAQMKIEDLWTGTELREKMMQAGVYPESVNNKIMDKLEYNPSHNKAVVTNYLHNREKMERASYQQYDPETDMLDGFLPMDYVALGMHMNPSKNLKRAKNNRGDALYDVYAKGDRDYINHQIDYLASKGVDVQKLQAYRDAMKREVVVQAPKRGLAKFLSKNNPDTPTP